MAAYPPRHTHNLDQIQPGDQTQLGRIQSGTVHHLFMPYDPPNTATPRFSQVVNEGNRRRAERADDTPIPLYLPEEKNFAPLLFLFSYLGHTQHTPTVDNTSQSVVLDNALDLHRHFICDITT